MLPKRKWLILGIVLVLVCAIAIGLSIYFTRPPTTSSVQSVTNGNNQLQHQLQHQLQQLQQLQHRPTKSTTTSTTTSTITSITTTTAPTTKSTKTSAIDCNNRKFLSPKFQINYKL